MDLKFHICILMILGILSLVAEGLGHLALTDIYHAEGNLSLEWSMLRVFAVIFLTFIAYSLAMLQRILKII
jgi:hypothetical protein